MTIQRLFDQCLTFPSRRICLKNCMTITHCPSAWPERSNGQPTTRPHADVSVMISFSVLNTIAESTVDKRWIAGRVHRH